MRNQLSTIVIPKFADLKMGLSNYSVTITLNITEEIAEILSKRRFRHIKTFCWKNRWYVQHMKNVDYTYPLTEALYVDAYRDLANLKVIIREAKISLLKSEIAVLTDEWNRE